MKSVVHIYCDESCHLENDRMKAMVLGALCCPADRRKSISRRLKELKAEHGLSPGFEIKWVKVSPAKLAFYKLLVDLFFDEPMLNFRGVIVPDKKLLDHERFGQNHDEFYYKQWFLLLDRLIKLGNGYRIFIDIKDTQGSEKVGKLHEILCNARYDFNQDVINSIEQVQSDHVPLLQLADLLIGVLSYAHRGLLGSPAKQALVSHVQGSSGLNLLKSSSLNEQKFNLLVWRGRSC